MQWNLAQVYSTPNLSLAFHQLETSILSENICQDKTDDDEPITTKESRGKEKKNYPAWIMKKLDGGASLVL